MYGFGLGFAMKMAPSARFTDRIVFVCGAAHLSLLLFIPYCIGVPYLSSITSSLFVIHIIDVVDVPAPAMMFVELIELIFAHPSNELGKEHLIDVLFASRVFNPFQLFESVHALLYRSSLLQGLVVEGENAEAILVFQIVSDD